MLFCACDCSSSSRNQQIHRNEFYFHALSSAALLPNYTNRRTNKKKMTDLELVIQILIHWGDIEFLSGHTHTHTHPHIRITRRKKIFFFSCVSESVFSHERRQYFDWITYTRNSRRILTSFVGCLCGMHICLACRVARRTFFFLSFREYIAVWKMFSLLAENNFNGQFTLVNDVKQGKKKLSVENDKQIKHMICPRLMRAKCLHP